MDLVSKLTHSKREVVFLLLHTNIFPYFDAETSSKAAKENAKMEINKEDAFKRNVILILPAIISSFKRISIYTSVEQAKCEFSRQNFFYVNYASLKIIRQSTF